MIRLLILLIIINIISYGKNLFQIDFFYPDKEYFSYTNRMPEHEFNYFLENHPYNIAKSPILIVKFIPPSPYYKINKNQIYFYSDKRRKKINDIYYFKIFTQKNQIESLILGSQKSYTPFGNNKNFFKTFYIALPKKIINEKKIYILIKNKQNKILNESQIEVKKTKKIDTFIQNKFKILDNSGKLFFNIKCVKNQGEMQLNIEVKNLTNEFINFSTSDFTINTNNKYFHPNLNKTISLNPGEIKNFTLIFKIKNIPLFSIINYTIMCNNELCNFTKKIKL